jgi:hypothetical protein
MRLERNYSSLASDHHVALMIDEGSILERGATRGVGTFGTTISACGSVKETYRALLNTVGLIQV